MKIRTSTDDGTLVAESAVDWAGCLAATKEVYTESTAYLLIGKQLSAGTYSCWQSFLRFDGAAIPASHAIKSAKIRIYIAASGDQSDTDFDVAARLISTYGTLDATDWYAAPGGGPNGSFTADTADIATDSDGYSYLDLELNAIALASISKTTTFDVLLMHSSQSDEPTGDEYLKCYSANNSTWPRPYIEVVTQSEREQVLDALETRLGTIDEYSGYNTTPVTVSRRPLSFATLNQPDFPAAFIWPQTDAENQAEGTFAHRFAYWDVQVHAGIYYETEPPDDIGTALEAYISDLQRVLETDVGSRNPLGLSFVNSIDVVNIDTAEGVIDDNRATAVLTVRFNYTHKLNES